MRLLRSRYGVCGPFQWAREKAFGLLIVTITLAASVIFSSCASTSSAGSGPSNGSSLIGSNATPIQASISGNHDVDLSWGSSSSSGVVGYNVYRGTGPGGPYRKLNGSIIPANTYRDNAVESGQTYYYVVTATGANNSESGYSNEVVAPIP